MASPFKVRPISAFRVLPSADAIWIKPDPCHTYAIGWGKDFAASSLLLMARLRLFGLGGCQARLNEAFSRLKAWCKQHGKSTSLTELSLKTFKVKTSLGISFGEHRFLQKGILYIALYVHSSPSKKSRGLGFRV